ncbi:YciI family protein [Vibrio hannami]|uniref:YciI family protein n=1 Tax=Vibrio hannami TaxID=2717094 RepID=UPI0024107889|nr:YciI family protein [Vibrio hannami]MDG3085338.1 YciI family protein [Vibrio hannami]
MFIVSLTYVSKIEEIEKYLSAHVMYLDKHYESGVFLASGRKVPRTGGVILAKSDTPESLEAILKEDPFYINKLAEYDITEFLPTKVSQELSILIE